MAESRALQFELDKRPSLAGDHSAPRVGKSNRCQQRIAPLSRIQLTETLAPPLAPRLERPARQRDTWLVVRFACCGTCGDHRPERVLHRRGDGIAHAPTAFEINDGWIHRTAHYKSTFTAGDAGFPHSRG